MLRIRDADDDTSELLFTAETLESNRGVLEALAADNSVIEVVLADVGFPGATCSDFERAVLASYPTDARQGFQRVHVMRGVLACKNTAPAVLEMIDWLGTPWGTRYARGQFPEDLNGTSLFARATALLTADFRDDYNLRLSRKIAFEAAETGDTDAFEVCSAARGGFSFDCTCKLFERAASHGGLAMTTMIFDSMVRACEGPDGDPTRDDFYDAVLGAFRGALEGGHMPIVRWMWDLSEKQGLPCFMKGSAGLTMFRWWCDAGTPEAFDWLIEVQAANPPSRDNMTDWWQHANRNRVWALERLTTMVGFPDNDYLIDNLVRAAARGGHVDVLRFLAANGVTDFDGHVEVALQNGHVAVLEFFHERGLQMTESGIFERVQRHCQVGGLAPPPKELIGLEWAINRALTDGEVPQGPDIFFRSWVKNPRRLLLPALYNRNCDMLNWVFDRFAKALGSGAGKFACKVAAAGRWPSLEMLKLLDGRGLLCDSWVDDVLTEAIMNLNRSFDERGPETERIVDWLWTTKPRCRSPSVPKRVFLDTMREAFLHEQADEKKKLKAFDWILRMFGADAIPKGRQNRHLLQAARHPSKRAIFRWMWANLYNDEERTALMCDPSISALPKTKAALDAEGGTESRKRKRDA